MLYLLYIDKDCQKGIDINKKNHPIWMVCRPTGIRTPTDGTKNRSATVTL